MKKLKRLSLSELMQETSVINQKDLSSFVGGGDGTFGNPYTEQEFGSLCDGGMWGGGYVDNWGYVSNQITCFNQGSRENWEYYDSAGSWISDQQQTWYDHLAAQLIGSLPGGIGQGSAYISQSHTNTYLRIAGSLYNSNLGSSPIYHVYDEVNMSITIYNASSGEKIGTWPIEF